MTGGVLYTIGLCASQRPLSTSASPSSAAVDPRAQRPDTISAARRYAPPRSTAANIESRPCKDRVGDGDFRSYRKVSDIRVFL